MEELIKEIRDYVADMIEINNEMLIKIIYQLLMSSTLLTMYLTQNGVVKTDFENFVEGNKGKVSEYLKKEAEELIKLKKEVKK